jgi:uncharacterized protein (TIGR02284 family)
MRVFQGVSSAESRLVEVLNDLMAFDFDVMAAYEAAIARIEDIDERRLLGSLEQGHRRQVDELTACVSMLGGQPRSMGDARIVATQARVLLANLRGERKIFEALGSNERATARRYDSAVHEWAHRAPPRISEVLLRGLETARNRHRRLLAHHRRPS